jgi:hypothetical protein
VSTSLFRIRPVLLSLACAFSVGTQAQTLDPAFSASYTVADLGSVPGLPSNYGGLTFLDADHPPDRRPGEHRRREPLHDRRDP